MFVVSFVCAPVVSISRMADTRALFWQTIPVKCHHPIRYSTQGADACKARWGESSVLISSPTPAAKVYVAAARNEPEPAE